MLKKYIEMLCFAPAYESNHFFLFLYPQYTMALFSSQKSFTKSFRFSVTSNPAAHTCNIKYK